MKVHSLKLRACFLFTPKVDVVRSRAANEHQMSEDSYRFALRGESQST